MTETNSARHYKLSCQRLAFPRVYKVNRNDCIDLSAFILKGPSLNVLQNRMGMKFTISIL